MFKSWSVTDNIKDENFNQNLADSRRATYSGIEAPELRDYVNKVDIGRPIRNVYENTQHLQNFDERAFYNTRGVTSGVFRKSLVNGFSSGDTDVVTVTVNPGSGDTIKFYARLGPGIAYLSNKQIVVSRPQTHIAERQIAKILKLEDWKDEGVTIQYFYNTDLYQAKIVQRDINGNPRSYYFTGGGTTLAGVYVPGAFKGDSSKWGDSRVGFSSALKLFEAMYQGDTVVFRPYFRTSIGDSLGLITCEPILDFKRMHIVPAGDTVFWKIDATGKVYGDTTAPKNTDFPLWAYRVAVATKTAGVVGASRGDSRTYITNYQDFGQHIFLNVPNQWGDTTTLNSTNPYADSKGFAYNYVNNRDDLIVFMRQSGGASASALFGWKESLIPGILPVHSQKFWMNKDLVVSRWMNAGDTLGRAWASVMEMSGDSWVFYGDKGLRYGNFFPMATTGQVLGKPSNTWKLWGDSIVLIGSLKTPDLTITPPVIIIGDVPSVQRTSIWGDTVNIGDTNGLINLQGSSRVLSTKKLPGTFYGGTSNPSGAIRLNYDGYLYATTFQTTSSREFKASIKHFKENALDIINNTKVVTFNYKEDPDKKVNVGFIAEDTHELLSGKNHDIFDLNNTIGVLLKGTQELAKKVETLEKANKKIQELEKKVALLDKRVGILNKSLSKTEKNNKKKEARLTQLRKK